MKQHLSLYFFFLFFFFFCCCCCDLSFSLRFLGIHSRYRNCCWRWWEKRMRKKSTCKIERKVPFMTRFKIFKQRYVQCIVQPLFTLFQSWARVSFFLLSSSFAREVSNAISCVCFCLFLVAWFSVNLSKSNPQKRSLFFSSPSSMLPNCSRHQIEKESWKNKKNY